MPGRAPCGLVLSTQEQGLGKFMRVCAIKNDPVKGNIKRFTRACLLEHLHLMARVPIQLLINLFGVPVVPAPFSRMLDNLNYSCGLSCPAPRYGPCLLTHVFDAPTMCQDFWLILLSRWCPPWSTLAVRTSLGHAHKNIVSLCLIRERLTGLVWMTVLKRPLDIIPKHI